MCDRCDLLPFTLQGVVNKMNDGGMGLIGTAEQTGASMNKSPIATAARPFEMGMAIQSGILKSLGINLYTNLGKVIVEFIANAYDGDAKKVTVKIPIDRIVQERAKKIEADRHDSERQAFEVGAAVVTSSGDGEVQGADQSVTTSAHVEAAEAKVAELEMADGASIKGSSDVSDQADGESSTSDAAMPSTPPVPLTLNLETLFDTLPEDVKVVIEDDGHGMTWEEVERKFLPLNRQRRADAAGKEVILTSPGGRYVMGRKGVGKLAGFGAALTVELWTKRRGETSATLIKLVDEDLNQAGTIHNVKIPVTYEDGLDPQLQGTRVTLSRLKADATRDSIDKIRRVITKSFHAIRPEDFAIIVNDETLKFDLPSYEFIYPPELTRERIVSGERAEMQVPVPGIGGLTFRYYVGFLPRSHGSGADRGATIYCNNRLAAGPALFGLPTGMHSFHSVDYMDCIIEADDLDRSDIDFVNTARNGIKEGNEVVGTMLETVVRVMRSAIAAHARFKKKEADRKLGEDKTARIISATIEALPKKTRKAGKKLLQTIAQTFEVGTPEFEELAPVIVHSINATEVLINLVSHGTDVATIGQIMGQLRQLSEIEKRDALKLYRARRGGIEKLEIMYERGRDNWKKKQFEKDLHQLLKENPWLIRPEFSNYISSDQGINTTVSRLAADLKVDAFAPIVDGEELSDVRPDLVFLMSDPMDEGPYTVKIVELKSPGLPLTIAHWRQLEDYVDAVKEWCRVNLPHTVRVSGYLIGAMPLNESAVQAERRLLDKFRDTGVGDPIQIVGLLELIKLARAVHIQAIKALDRDLSDEDDDEDELEADSDNETIADDEPVVIVGSSMDKVDMNAPQGVDPVTGGVVAPAGTPSPGV